MWPEYQTIGVDEERAVLEVLRSGKLSGFIAGPPDERDVPNGGPTVRALEAAWCERYGVRHAVSFNSATSALLASCGAVGLCSGDHVIVPPWTMSATAAAPLFYGAVVDFADVEDETFCLDVERVADCIEQETRMVFAVNLFGHPARVSVLRRICDEAGIVLVEDSAQTPLAKEYGKIAGTVGHIGVYSLNRHKHIHCGEGGIAVTDDDELARGLRSVRNHGIDPLGLNLRMTELEAAIALAQLRKLDEHVAHARNLGEALSEGLKDLMDVPKVRLGCEHDYYLWTAKFDGDLPGIPHIRGYIQPLHRIFDGGFASCPVVERLRNEVVCIECAKWDMDPQQMVELIRVAI